jgi:hypothetical protein
MELIRMDNPLKRKRLPKNLPPGRWVRRGIAGTLLLLLWLVAASGPQTGLFQAAAGAPTQFVLVVHDSSDSFDSEIMNNVTWALKYARLNYDTLDLAKPAVWPRLGQYSSLLFAAEELGKIDTAQARQIVNYVNDGGGLAVVFRGWHPELAPLFGLESGIQPRFIADYQSEPGLFFHTDFFPGLKGLSLTREAVAGHSLYGILDLHFLPDSKAEVIASSNTGRPIGWLNQYGQGRTIYWNTDVMITKAARGFIVQSILSVQPVGVSPIVNFATIQIDDFPFPASTQKLEPIATEYDMTAAEFFDKVWMPDMMALAREYNIIYTCLIPFNYNSLIESPFNFKEWEHAKVTIDGQELVWSVYASHALAQGHELGLHGYNHVSLLLDYWVKDRDSWLAARRLVSAQAVVSAQEQLETLAATEHQARAAASAVMAKAVAKKRAEADEIVYMQEEIAALTAEEETGTLSPEGQARKTDLLARADQITPEQRAKAQRLLALPDAELAQIVTDEARQIVAGAGPDKLAEAAATVAELEREAEDNMVAGLLEAARRWQADNLGPLPISYVAPNNLYDAAGARALSRAFPSLKILAGNYIGDFETGAHREFSPEPWNPELFDMPRITYSYGLTPSSQFAWISSLGMMGVWTYFNHPDDVFHTPQNYPSASFHRNPTNLPWRGDHTGQQNGFYYLLKDWLELARQTYPWLRYVGTAESLEMMQTHLDNQVTVDLNPEMISLKSTSPTYFQVRINDNRRLDLNTMAGAQVVHLYTGDGYRLYILRGVKTEVQLPLLPADKPAPPKAAATPVFEPVNNDVLPTEYRDSANFVPVQTVAPTPTLVPTATPDLNVLPIPTPTLRSRP